MFIFSLTERPLIGYILNMFRATKSLSKSQEKLPFLGPVRGGVLWLLRDAGLLEPGSPAPLSHEELKP
jgi:hypothetical protein